MKHCISGFHYLTKPHPRAEKEGKNIFDAFFWGGGETISKRFEIPRDLIFARAGVGWK